MIYLPAEANGKVLAASKETAEANGKVLAASKETAEANGKVLVLVAVQERGELSSLA